MAGNQNFRSALGGFNREDVVHYIEYLNTKHNNTVNQLKSENRTLTEELEQLRAQPALDPELEAQCEALQAENSALSAQVAEMEQEIARLQAALSEAEDKASSRVAAEELEAYRRAERMERAAQERTQQIYRQVMGTLAETATQVDDAADQFKRMSQEFSAHMTEMQDMIDRSRNALMGASATMYSIRPVETHEE